MASGSGKLTYDGRDVILEALSEKASAIAIGDADGTAYRNDTEMDVEDYRFAIDETSWLDNGAIRFSINVIGGTNIPTGYEVSEYGLFDSTADNSGRMIYHKFTNITVVNSGVEQELTVDLNARDIGTI